MQQPKEAGRNGTRPRAFFLALLFVFSVIGAGVAIFASRFVGSGTPPLPPAIGHPANMPEPRPDQRKVLMYNPPKLTDAPADIRDTVILGYNIVTDTAVYAAAYVGNTLKCTNCHLKLGISEGGTRGGISLVGVAVTYPQYRERQHAAVDLVRRTNDCFERSMNGKSLPRDSKEMTALLTYYQWIARGLPVYADVPWLGLKPIKGSHKGDPVSGRQVFAVRCAMCHGADGQGTVIAPPVWGPRSFNSGAGMAKAETMASFTFHNMPNGNPDLREEEALDVAAFVAVQPRPKFAAR